jgi:hypothetical protein
MRILVCIQLAIGCASFTHLPAASAQTAIYRCEIDGVPTFSDRQCGPESQPIPTRDLNVSEAPLAAAQAAVAAPKPKPVRSEGRKDPVAKNQVADKAAEACAKLALSLQEIRSKMRAGYGVKEGERLRDRQNSLRARQKVARCS